MHSGVSSMPLRPAVIVLLAPLLALAACGYGRPNRAASQLGFGTDMARRGLWHEALFRFKEAERLEPDNPRIQSNLGVAYEAQGDFELALASYQKALKLAPNDKGIRTNYARFVEFYQGFKGEKTAKSGLDKATSTTHKGGKAGERPANGPGPAAPPSPRGPSDVPQPSPPGDVPPPPADNRPPL
jgi:tetratricopeptide (TPR) repeat protein